VALSTKLIRGSSVNLVEHALKIGLMFVITPLMIRHLGEHDYGIWLLALAIIGWLRLLDLGVSFSGARFLGKAIGAENDAEYRALTVTLSWLFLWIGAACLVLTVLIVLTLPIWIVEPDLLQKVRWLVLGFGIAIAVRFWTRIFEVILKGHVRYDLIGVAAIVKSILQGGLILFFLLTGHGLLTLLIVFIATDILDQLLLVLFARRVSPEASLAPSHRNRETIAPLLKFSATAMVTNTGHSLRGGIDPLIIAKLSGVAAVPVYSIGARFLSVFTDIINAIFGGNFLAAFSQLHGRDDRESLIRSFLASIRHSAAIATLGGAALLMYGPAFIERWVGPGFADSGKVLMILTPPTVISLMQYPIWGFFYSQDKQHWLAALTFGGGVFNLVLSLILASHMGFFGVVWATLIEMTISFGILVPLMAIRVCRIRARDYLAPLLSSLLKVGLISLAYFGAVRLFIAPDYLRLILLGLGHLLVALPIFWFLVLSAEEQTRLRQALPRLSRRET